MKSKVAVLVSGGGTNLQTLIDFEKEKGCECPYEIAVVISDHRDAFALQRAQKAGIPAAVTSPFSVMGKETAQNATRDEKRLPPETSRRLRRARERRVRVERLADLARLC